MTSRRAASCRAVAADHEPAAALVPDGEGEHAVEPSRQLHRRELLRQVGDHLGVAARPEACGLRRKSSAGLEVVDLAVEHGRDRLVLVRDRRVASDKIDDRQTVLGDYPVVPGMPRASGRGGRGVELGLDGWPDLTRLRGD